MTTGPIALSVDRLEKRFGQATAVSDLSFELREGEVFGLLGSNGAGKTTAISMLASELAPTRGNATLFGRSVSARSKAVRRMIGVVPQQIALYPMLTAAENIRFFGRVYGLRRTELEDRIDELLAFAGLNDRRNDFVRTLSGGMMRRLNVAVALVHNPRLILLDEPTVGVDPHSRERIFHMVKQLREAGNAVLYTTHYLEEAQTLCDRIGILNQGRLVALGTFADLLADFRCGEIIELRGLSSISDLDELRAANGVCDIETSDGSTRIFVSNATPLLETLRRVVARSQTPVRLKIAPVGLDHLFMHLTRKHEGQG